MRRVFLVVAATVLALVAACSSFSGDSAPNEDHADAAPPSSDASPLPDLVVEDAAVTPSDAGPDAFVTPAGMVRVVTPNGTFAIDGHEVSAFDYDALATKLANPPAGTPRECLKATGYARAAGNCPSPGDELVGAPAACVDWCDAYVYCLARGARLCGSIIGGSVLPTTPALSEWTIACEAHGGAFPYGAAGDPKRCNTHDNPDNSGHDVLTSGALPNCQGGVTGLFDMSGNLWEWEDDCTTDATGARTMCAYRGGSVGDAIGGAACAALKTAPLGTTGYNIGFRCCAP